MSAEGSKRRLKGLQAARTARESAEWVFLEFFLIAALAGFAAGSWWVFFGTLLLLAAINSSPVAPLLFVTISVGWGALAYLILQKEDAGLRLPVALVVFGVSWAVHEAGRWWSKA